MEKGFRRYKKIMAHQHTPILHFSTPEQHGTKNKIQGYQRETNKCVHIFHNEHQGMRGLGNI